MKEKFQKIQFLVYAVILFLVASLLESYLSGLKTYDIDSDRVTKVLHEKEEKLDSILVKVQYIFENNKDIIHQNSVSIIDLDDELLQKEGFSIFVFENDSIKYWSDNITSAKSLYSQSSLNNRIVKLSNGWYEVRTNINKNFVYVGLISLKKQYSLENKYLSNEYATEFHLSPTIQLSMIPVSYGFDIQDKEGKYIFSLVPRNSLDPDPINLKAVGFLFWLSFLSLMIFLYSYINSLCKTNGNCFKIIMIISSVLLVRLLMIITKIPSNVYSLDFFDPVYYSGSFLFPTFGDFIINSIIIIFVPIYIFQLTKYINLKEKIKEWTDYTKGCMFIGLSIICILIFIALYNQTLDLVSKSSISFQLNNFFTLDIFSISGIGIFIVLFASVIYTTVKITDLINLSDKSHLKKALLIISICGVLFSIICTFTKDIYLGLSIIYLTSIILASCFMHYAKAESSVYRYIFMIFLSAILSCLIITHTTEEKRIEDSKKYVTQIADEHDRIAELLLGNISEELSNDALVTDYLVMDTQKGLRLCEYLQRWHFNGYWSKYNLSLSIDKCEPGQYFEDLNSENCVAINKYGRKVANSDFYFIDNPAGNVCYIEPMRVVANGNAYYVCIKLESKPVPRELGYPELLMDNKIASSFVSGYDYAKYRNGKKTKQNGEFSYDLSDKILLDYFENQNDSIITVNFSNKTHTIYKSKNDTIIISRKSIGFSDYVVLFAYLFVVYIVVMLIYLAIKLLVTHSIKEYSSQLKIKLVLSVSLVLVLAFVIVCIAMAYFNAKRFQSDNMAGIDDKIKSVYMHLEQNFGDSTSFVAQWNENINSTLDEYLTKVSHVFFTDVNLYSPEGELLGSSRPEVFKQGLISSRINSTAFKSLVLDSKANYIQEENIGSMSYTSAYIPFYNSQENLMGYINLPYFTRPDVMKRELSTMIVSLVNLFVVLMSLSIFIAVIVSERMVHPIRMIQNMLEKIELGKKHEKIEYNRNDEIGQLVTEYNKMVDKLEESATLLAQSERESAWREMAKQIAHEIKNPLTPMKMNIQFLLRSKNDEGFDNRLEKVCNILIQQIDTLSSIATGFSNFAKMPKPVEVPFNIVETLSNVVQLFKNDSNIEITSDFGNKNDVTIVADKEQISRVFVNLIKNATQAIPDGINGKIHVALECKDNLVVKISDNGCGIPDEIRGKLFTPSFTTKSSGSGLGLAMCKNIIINARGEITFESKVGKGTTFIVTLPLGK